MIICDLCQKECTSLSEITDSMYVYQNLYQICNECEKSMRDKYRSFIDDYKKKASDDILKWMQKEYPESNVC